MLPYPKKVTYLEGIASPACPVEETMNASLETEEYHIHISPEKILLEGGSKTGLSYGKTTLEQLKLLYSQGLPCMEIQDKPFYPYRSFHIDCARHFFPAEQIKKMIRMCAEFKLNHFHWHISDDQGWRVESLRFPRLHEIGSVREGDHFDKCSSEELQGGYYTRREVKEIVALCEELGIEVVPEVDMPGHVMAILAAYPQYGCENREVKVGTRSGIFQEILCAGKEETFTFIEELLDDLMELFPGRYFHIGGDEAPKSHWKACPHCRKRMEEEHLESFQQLQGYVENRISSYLISRGKIPVVWNEAVYGGNLDPAVVVQLWIDDRDGMMKAHLDKGGKAVVSNVMNSYCDYPYGSVSLRNMYELNTRPAELGERGEDSVIGTECLMWTEHVRDGARMEELCWPRFAASAQVGWCGPDRPPYEEFEQCLMKLLPLFERHGIHIMEPEGWNPDPETAAAQIAAFNASMFPEDVEASGKAAEDI